MKNTQLSKAIALALTGAALSLGAVSTASAASTSMYNLSGASATNPTAGGSWNLVGATDGWTAGATWAGTTGTSATPFGYVGAHLNWGFEITGGAGGSGTISTFDANSKYGAYADIDTAKGAWSDAASSGASGWRHDLDQGLFKSDTAGLVTLSATGIMQSGTQFGFTIFKGMNTSTSYNHHGGWNAGNNASGITAASLPGGGTSFTTSDIVAYSVGGTTPSNLNSISFNAEAGQIYSIFIGGYRNGSWGDTNDGYALSISQAAPVPLPGAAWLFGGALATLLGAKRRKSVMPA